jgi:hypothetical protein
MSSARIKQGTKKIHDVTTQQSKGVHDYIAQNEEKPSPPMVKKENLNTTITHDVVNPTLRTIVQHT